ncbi:hypothetical protein KDA_53910 [Dictyobacter alpinus]|uniref:Uncharacterized protein n=1 Tax=Dictyobacter alpinus TaxID=2014873 RepID=A0A402BF82_9CHLR|nr:hypothetical protein KDA_53910 [Dictyobacter alpinus]
MIVMVSHPNVAVCTNVKTCGYPGESNASGSTHGAIMPHTIANTSPVNRYGSGTLSGTPRVPPIPAFPVIPIFTEAG